MKPAHPALDTHSDHYSAWNPGISPGIPTEFRSLETLFRSECALTGAEEVAELADWTGLAHEELTAFRPERLALHELIIRVTADISVSEGDEEEVFGQNFRRIAGKIFGDYIMPRMDHIERVHAELRAQTETAVHQILDETLFKPAPKPARRAFPFNLFGGNKTPAAPVKSVHDLEFEAIAGFKTAGLAETDPLRRAVFKSLYRVLGAVMAKRGSLGSDRELLTRLITRHVCNLHGSHLIGHEIVPLIDAAIATEGYARVPNRPSPILISLKGASAAGKSSLRPMLKQLMRDQGIEPGGYITISPDVWRRMLLDYDSLGPARKYAGYLTSREIVVIDGKLDRYIRFKANRDHGIPHFLVDRFRFDSFASEKVGRVLHDTYAKYVDTMYMYFVVTPPEETVERGWQRGLERGRYKAVEDFLGHCVEAYAGMPKLLFKWLANKSPDYRYVFLDNLVPRGTFPKTIATGNRHTMTIYDPMAFINIERYQKINLNAHTPDKVCPPLSQMDVAANLGFLKECLRRIEEVEFVSPETNAPYARTRNGAFELLDADAFDKMTRDPLIEEVFNTISGPAKSRHTC